jgi:S-DNA-T family DNA segregation ATPase FtsK/SpoIIIE
MSWKKKNRENFKKERNQGKPEEKKKKDKAIGRKAKNAIVVVILFALALLSLVAFFGKAGIAGTRFVQGIGWLLGVGKFSIPLFFFIGAFSILRRFKKPLWITLLGMFLLIFSFSSLVGALFHSGGALGNALGGLAVRYLDKIGATIILVAFFLVSSILALNLSFGFLFKKDREEEGVREGEQKDQQRQPELGLDEKKESIFGKFADKKSETRILRHPIFRLRGLNENKKETKEGTEVKTVAIDMKEEGYVFPTLDLLSLELLDKEGVQKPEINQNIEIIKSTLENFDIPVTTGEVSVGPTVTQYTLKPSKGIKLSQIVALQNDMSLALAAHPLRIEAPIPGKSWVGVEVPNKSKHIVKLRNLLEEKGYQKEKNYLTLPIGRNVAGEAVYTNLAKMPHLLVAGATGSGKSVAIHNILTAFLYQNSPRTLRLILVDPKRVELTAYNGIPHLLTPVIVEAQKAINSLKWSLTEMERRYELLSDLGTRDILSYNEKVSKLTRQEKESNENKHRQLPYIVIVIDELADIMMTYGREMEAAVVRLAQMARAVGIHLILSTQRPSVEVITGLIKANITNRMAFQVASQVDSRTILDMAGAEKLLGNGDMLYLTSDSSKPKRIQGAFILEREVKKVVDFIKNQKYEEDTILDLALGREEEKTKIDEFKNYEFEDELFAEAKKVIIESKKASASLLQRRLRVGYARAARILDMLEADGTIGPAKGSKAREVIQRREKNEL